MTITPDLDEAERFLALLDSSGVFTFQTFDDRKDGSDNGLAKVFHGTLADHSASLIALNQRGAGVFVMVNEGDGVIKPGKKTCRTKDNVTRIRAVFVDLDGAPLEPVLGAKWKPHIVVESSPGRWHAYYLVKNCPLEKFKSVQLALASRFDGDDTVFDLPRVMRMPGFFHQKDQSFMTRFVKST